MPKMDRLGGRGTAAGGIDVLDSPHGLVVRADAHNRVVGALWRENQGLRESRRRDDILTAAMAEIYATLRGESTQPIQRIVDGCRAELLAR